MASVFDLIKQSADDYRQEAQTLIGYSAWILLPFAAFVLLSLLPDTGMIELLALILMIAELYLIIWITITISLLTFAHAKGTKTDHNVLSIKARQLVTPVLTVALLQALILIGGFLLLVIPFFIFAVWFGLSQLVTIFEGRRGLDALSRSRTLTKDYFWHTAILLIIGPLLIMLMYSVVISLLVAVGSKLQGINPIDLLLGDLPLWVNVLEAVGEIFLLPFMLIYFTRVYLDLTSRIA